MPTASMSNFHKERGRQSLSVARPSHLVTGDPLSRLTTVSERVERPEHATLSSRCVRWRLHESLVVA